MTHRQPKLPLALRIIAAGCVALWLAGVSACNLESLFCCASHGNHEAAYDHGDSGADAEANHAHDEGSHHSHDAEGHSHGSHKHESKEGSCCSMLKAVALTAKPIVFGKPACQSIPFQGVLLETRATLPASSSEKLSTCQTKSRNWVFTPEVYLGPAFRSLAPPAFI